MAGKAHNDKGIEFRLAHSGLLGLGGLAQDRVFGAYNARFARIFGGILPESERFGHVQPYPMRNEPEVMVHFQREMSLKLKNSRARSVWVDHSEDG
ncbi:MAG: hypothetical protein LBQ81_06215, partial [Zoogloeaceae bacterium]|nr:hypothetical protein [Zoogloeaceae bacterium]